MASTPVATRRPPARPAARTGSSTRGSGGPRRRPAGRRRPPRRDDVRLRGPVVLLVVVAALVVLAATWDPPRAASARPTGCTLAGSDLQLTTEEAANAATIAAVARGRGLSGRATVIALATAQQESRLRNLDHGDRDSLGLFQQRPSQGWGTPAQVQDPVHAAGTFFDRLVEVPGWQTGRLTVVAQAVQRSGFPEAYQRWEPLATQLAGALLAPDAGHLTCSFPRAGRDGTRADRARGIAATATTELRVPVTSDLTGSVTVPGTAGWPGASWAVAHADQFQLAEVGFDGHRWTPATGWTTDTAAGADAVRLRLAG
jgi:hypothetical protein